MSEKEKIKVSYQILTIQELIELRIRYNLDIERADVIFGLKQGSYFEFESGTRTQTIDEDYLIRSTNVLDINGFNILPLKS